MVGRIGSVRHATRPTFAAARGGSSDHASWSSDSERVQCRFAEPRFMVERNAAPRDGDSSGHTPLPACGRAAPPRDVSRRGSWHQLAARSRQHGLGSGVRHQLAARSRQHGLGSGIRHQLAARSREHRLGSGPGAVERKDIARRYTHSRRVWPLQPRCADRFASNKTFARNVAAALAPSRSVANAASVPPSPRSGSTAGSRPRRPRSRPEHTGTRDASCS